MSKFSAVKFDLAEVSQKLAQASSCDEIITVLDVLTKNGLDELARQEGITFPRSVSKMKRADMAAILAEELATRNQRIDNGEEFSVSVPTGISPIMEARYSKNGKADFVAASVNEQKERIASKYGEISVRVVDWNAVEKRKAQAANPVSDTESEPETAAIVAVEDYSTALVPEVIKTFDGTSGVGAVTEHNNALVKACSTPEELFELLKTADKLTLDRLYWRNGWLPRAYGHIKNGGLTTNPLVDVRNIVDFVVQEFEQRGADPASVTALVPVHEADSDAEKQARRARLSALLAQADDDVADDPVPEVIEAQIVEEPNWISALAGVTRSAFEKTRRIAHLVSERNLRERVRNTSVIRPRKVVYDPKQIMIKF